jgi:hypothetical protein
MLLSSVFEASPDLKGKHSVSGLLVDFSVVEITHLPCTCFETEILCIVGLPKLCSLRMSPTLYANMVTRNIYIL